MKVVKIIFQVIVDLIVQGYEVIVIYGNGLQVGMINQVFEVVVKIEVYLLMLLMFVCVVLSQGYIGYDL